MAAARPSAHNAEFRVFILVLRRLRPVFVVPRARLRVRRESPPAAGLGEWQTACRGLKKAARERGGICSLRMFLPTFGPPSATPAAPGQTRRQGRSIAIEVHPAPRVPRRAVQDACNHRRDARNSCIAVCISSRSLPFSSCACRGGSEPRSPACHCVPRLPRLPTATAHAPPFGRAPFIFRELPLSASTSSHGHHARESPPAAARRRPVHLARLHRPRDPAQRRSRSAASGTTRSRA